jgi:hypothetical protein
LFEATEEEAGGKTEDGVGEPEAASLSLAATSLLKRLLFLPALMTSNARCCVEKLTY